MLNSTQAPFEEMALAVFVLPRILCAGSQHPWTLTIPYIWPGEPIGRRLRSSHTESCGFGAVDLVFNPQTGEVAVNRLLCQPFPCFVLQSSGNPHLSNCWPQNFFFFCTAANWVAINIQLPSFSALRNQAQGEHHSPHAG